MDCAVTKKHFCLYCKKSYPKIARHLEDMHSDEFDVARVLSKNKKSKERRAAWAVLTKKGDFNHNYECVETGGGVLVPKYRSKQKTQGDYVTCGVCFGLYSKRILWKHQKTCEAATEKGKESDAKGIGAGKLLMPVKIQNKRLRDNILVDMNDCDVKEVVQGDRLILEYGNRLLEKHPEPHKKTYISNKMRELGRLVQHTKHDNIRSIEDCLDPCHFESVLLSVKAIAGYDNDTGMFKRPSLALKVGYSLKKCCKILKSKALREEDDAKEKKCTNFLALYEEEWCDRIAGHAHNTLDSRKYNTPKLLPFTEDVKKVHCHLQTIAKEAKKSLEQSSSYKLLAQVSLTQIILFNRRRSGESQRIKVQEVEAALNPGQAKTAESEVVKSLSAFERQLSRTHVRVETKGKRGRKVPVLLTEEMKENVILLLENRKTDGDFLFTMPGCAHPMRGTDCLRKFVDESGAKHPELLTSTRLRQQLATLSQVLGLSETSQDILATFLGHDIRVHRSFYRLPDDLLQTAKVSKVLHCINTGQISDLKGKDFDTINFDVEDQMEEECGDEQCGDEETSGTEETAAASDNHIGDKTCVTNDTPAFQSSVNGEKRSVHRQKRVVQRKTVVNPSSSDEDEDSDYECEQAISQKKQKKRKWSDAENGAIDRALNTFIRDHKVPGKRACEQAIAMESALKGREWKGIKFHVKNRIVSRKRRTSHTL
ncbi:hypothetical protein V1264_005754 [Littorina saxatilis]|uniref:Uncharacterized protein n=2 Tax=Littorina saxatilis TaxID=31220 RepID=A0AAN9AZU1_9CAEN